MHPVRFELTPPKRIELESTALDRSAMNAHVYIYIFTYISQRWDSNPRPPAYEAGAITTMLRWQVQFKDKLKKKNK